MEEIVMAQIYKNPIVQSDAILKDGKKARGYVSPAYSIDLDIDKFDQVYKKASADFPDDWGDKMDYIRQELGLKFPETIADVWYKKGKLYGLQTDAEDEPYEIELYSVNPTHNGFPYAKNDEEEQILKERLVDKLWGRK